MRIPEIIGLITGLYLCWLFFVKIPLAVIKNKTSPLRIHYTAEETQAFIDKRHQNEVLANLKRKEKERIEVEKFLKEFDFRARWSNEHMIELPFFRFEESYKTIQDELEPYGYIYWPAPSGKKYIKW